MSEQTIRPVTYMFNSSDNFIGVGGVSSNLAEYIDEFVLDTSDYIYDDGFGSTITSISRHMTLPFNLIPVSGYLTIVAKTNHSGRFNGPTLFAKKGTNTISIGGAGSTFHISDTFTEYNLPFTTIYNNASLAYNNGYSGGITLSFRPSGGFIGDPGINFDVSVAQAYATIFGEIPVNSSCTLFIEGPRTSTSGCTLHTLGPLPDTSGCTLYLHGPGTSVATGITLYECGHIPLNSGCTLFMFSDLNANLPLYISGPLYFSGNNNCTLFIRTDYSQSGNVSGNCTLHTLNYSLSSGELPLYISGPSSAIVDNSSTLYISGPIPLSTTKFTTLFIANYLGSGNNSTTLVIHNVNNSSGNSPLFIEGGGTDYRSGNIPLYITNFNSHSGNTTLYMPGGITEAFVPLTVGGRSWSEVNSGLTVFMNSTTNSGIYDYATLFVRALGHSANTPLFVGASESAENTDIISLYIENSTVTDNNITMFVENTVEALNSGVRLVVKGEGVNNGFNFGYNTMPIFMNRGNESVEKSTTLFITTPSGLVDSTDLYLAGANLLTSGVTFVMPSTIDTPSGNAKLYTHGF